MWRKGQAVNVCDGITGRVATITNHHNPYRRTYQQQYMHPIPSPPKKTYFSPPLESRHPCRRPSQHQPKKLPCAHQTSSRFFSPTRNKKIDYEQQNYTLTAGQRFNLDRSRQLNQTNSFIREECRPDHGEEEPSMGGGYGQQFQFTPDFKKSAFQSRVRKETLQNRLKRIDRYERREQDCGELGCRHTVQPAPSYEPQVRQYRQARITSNQSREQRGQRTLHDWNQEVSQHRMHKQPSRFFTKNPSWNCRPQGDPYQPPVLMRQDRSICFDQSYDSSHNPHMPQHYCPEQQPILQQQHCQSFQPDFQPPYHHQNIYYPMPQQIPYNPHFQQNSMCYPYQQQPPPPPTQQQFQQYMNESMKLQQSGSMYPQEGMYEEKMGEGRKKSFRYQRARERYAERL